MKTRFLLVMFMASIVAGCGAADRAGAIAEFSPALPKDSVDVNALDGLWQMSFSPLSASSENPDGKPCPDIRQDPATVKVSNGTILTWHFGGKGHSERIDKNGVFTFNRASGYAQVYPGTRDTMPRPINVTIRARISDTGTGEGAMVYVDENNEYAVCGSSLEFEKMD